MTLTFESPDNLDRQLRERASRRGGRVEDFLLGLIEQDADCPEGGRDADAAGLHSGQPPRAVKLDV